MAAGPKIGIKDSKKKGLFQGQQGQPGSPGLWLPLERTGFGSECTKVEVQVIFIARFFVWAGLFFEGMIPVQLIRIEHAQFHQPSPGVEICGFL